jgi:hypothetical protein
MCFTTQAIPFDTTHYFHTFMHSYTSKLLLHFIGYEDTQTRESRDDTANASL